MTDEPRYRLRRRSPIQVELLEGRALLSAVKTTTRPEMTELVISPSSQYVNQQEVSFTVTLYLKKDSNLQAAATLAAPLTLEFSASTDYPGVVTTEAPSPVFAPFHESVTFPAGTSAETVTVPIISSKPTIGSTEIWLSAAAPTLGPSVFPSLPGSLYLYSSQDASPPVITDVHLVTQGKLASAVVLGFSKPMAQATVENVQNYRILTRPTLTTHKAFLFWSGSTTREMHSFPIAAANYDPSTSKVTLTLKRPARASSVYEVSSAYPLDGHELTDTEGQPLASPNVFNAIQDGFTKLIHPIAGVIPSIEGSLKFKAKIDSPVSNFFHPTRGFL
jgi:hypothetical protein